MTKFKGLRSGLVNAFSFARNPKGSGRTWLNPVTSANTSSKAALTGNSCDASGIIPVSTSTLLSRLISREHFFYPDERLKIASLTSAVDALLFRTNYTQLEEMEKLYGVIDPVKGVIGEQSSNRKEVLDKELELLQRISRVLDQGGFVEIPVNSILGERDRDRGVSVTVDVAEYEVLRVWTRGQPKKKVPVSFYKRVYHYLWRPDQHCFAHVFTAIRQKSGNKLWLKVFMQVPQAELLNLLPSGMMKMNSFNRWLLKVTSATGGLSVGLLLLYPSQYLWAILANSVLLGVWSVSSYLNGRNNFLKRLAAIQYHHCTFSNQAAITQTIELAQDTKVKDLLLAYSFLLAPPNRPQDPKAVFSSKQPNYYTEARLKSTVQEWLYQTFNCSVNYNTKGAIKKLDELGLLVHRPDSTLSVLPIDGAVDLLPKPPSPWELKTLPYNSSINSEMTQKWPVLLEWK